MQPEGLIKRGARAIKECKYYSGGHANRKAREATVFEQRYATAAMVQLLEDLADLRVTLTPEGLLWWAREIEQTGGELNEVPSLPRKTRR